LPSFLYWFLCEKTPHKRKSNMARPRSPDPKDRVHININGKLLKRLRDDAQAQHRCISAHIEMLLQQAVVIPTAISMPICPANNVANGNPIATLSKKEG
jgi:hypothetical protein